MAAVTAWAMRSVSSAHCSLVKPQFGGSCCWRSDIVDREGWEDVRRKGELGFRSVLEVVEPWVLLTGGED